MNATSFGVTCTFVLMKPYDRKGHQNMRPQFRVEFVTNFVLLFENWFTFEPKWPPRRGRVVKPNNLLHRFANGL